DRELAAQEDVRQLERVDRVEDIARIQANIRQETARVNLAEPRIAPLRAELAAAQESGQDNLVTELQSQMRAIRVEVEGALAQTQISASNLGRVDIYPDTSENIVVSAGPGRPAKFAGRLAGIPLGGGARTLIRGRGNPGFGRDLFSAWAGLKVQDQVAGGVARMASAITGGNTKTFDNPHDVLANEDVRATKQDISRLSEEQRKVLLDGSEQLQRLTPEQTAEFARKGLRSMEDSEKVRNLSVGEKEAMLRNMSPDQRAHTLRQNETLPSDVQTGKTTEIQDQKQSPKDALEVLKEKAKTRYNDWKMASKSGDKMGIEQSQQGLIEILLQYKTASGGTELKISELADEVTTPVRKDETVSSNNEQQSISGTSTQADAEENKPSDPKGSLKEKHEHSFRINVEEGDSVKASAEQQELSKLRDAERENVIDVTHLNETQSIDETASSNKATVIPITPPDRENILGKVIGINTLIEQRIHKKAA
ncbi:MAG: hypothetical protein ABH950_05185, partial [Candidatus Altiarchaeota archaeon]